MLERRVEVQERLAALVSEAVGVTAQLFNVGAADRPDFLEAEVESRRVQLDLNAARNHAFAARQQSGRGRGRRGDRRADRWPDRSTMRCRSWSATRRCADCSTRARSCARRARTRTRAGGDRRGAARDVSRSLPARRRRIQPRARRAIGRRRSAGRVESKRASAFRSSIAIVAASPPARAEETRAEAELQRLELVAARAVRRRVRDLPDRDPRSRRRIATEILPRAEEAYRLYLARYARWPPRIRRCSSRSGSLLELSSEYLQQPRIGVAVGAAAPGPAGGRRAAGRRGESEIEA